MSDKKGSDADSLESAELDEQKTNFLESSDSLKQQELSQYEKDKQDVLAEME